MQFAGNGQAVLGHRPGRGGLGQGAFIGEAVAAPQPQGAPHNGHQENPPHQAPPEAGIRHGDEHHAEKHDRTGGHGNAQT